MKKEFENIKNLSSKIADNKDIDWQELEKGEDTKDGFINQLKAIQFISQQHKQFRENPETIEQDNHNPIFTWGHLQVLEKIGEGNYGKVYKAYDPVLDRNVALKLLKKDHLAPYQSRVFIQEARRLAKVRNPHVLAIHGANIHDSNAGMWSDLIIGENLASYKNKKYSKIELIQVARSLSDALKAVHLADLVHGDIKPSNVMHDNYGLLVLMDFGTSIERTSEKAKEEYVSGTPLFMAPELFSGHTLTPASDIYALGVLLFKLASECYPVTGESIIELDNAHKSGDYSSLSQIRPDLPKYLLQLIQLMMNPVAKKRPSAENVLKKLDWLQALPQRRIKIVALSVIFITLIIGTLVSTVGFFKIKKSQVLVIQEKEKTETVNQFLQQMLASAANLGKGRDVRVADILDVAATDINSGFEKQPHAKAAMHDALGHSYLHLNLPNKSIAQLKQSLSLKQKWHTAGSLEILKTQLELAKSYGVIGEINKSIKLHQKILQLANNNSLIETEFIQQVNISLANNLSDDGKLQEAETLFTKVLNQSASIKHSELNIEFLALEGLSNNYRVQSKYKKAEETAQLALKKLQEREGFSTSNLITIKNELAIILIKLGKLEQAETLFYELLQHSKKMYGTNNIGYLTILGNLGNTLQMHGNLPEAIQIQQQALELSNEIHGKNHKVSIMISISMANTIVSQGDKLAGEKLMRETMVKARTFLGESDIETLKLEYNLAELLNSLNRHEQAEMIARKNNKKMQELLGETHLFTLLSQDNIAVSLTGLKQFKKAQLLFIQIIDNIKQTVGEKSPYMILVQNHFVTLLLESNQSQLAIEQLQILIKLQSEVFGQDHADTLKSKLKLESILTVNPAA